MFKVVTPELIEALNFAREAGRGVLRRQNPMDVKTASALNTSAGRINGTVSTELRVRIFEEKTNRLETKVATLAEPQRDQQHNPSRRRRRR
jgi:hypothetical protein